jgi:hypothetical protein
MDERELRCLREISRCSPANVYYPIEPGEDLTAVSRRRAAALGFWTELKIWLKRNVWVTYFVASAAEKRFTAERLAITTPTMDAFDQLVAASPSIQFIKIDQKDEVALHADNAESRLSDAFLASRHVSYDRCSLSYAEFGTHDLHPTSEGYAHLARCVADAARRFELRKEAAAPASASPPASP